MNSNKKIHFEISERKVLLRTFDILLVLGSLFLISDFLNFDYFTFSTSNYHWAIILGLYLSIFGSVFEMYNLQVASDSFQIIKSTILTSSVTVLFYLLTPFFTPFLPSSRLQIIIFFLTLFGSLLSWRLFYVAFLPSHRFVKNAIIVCDKDQFEELTNEIKQHDPHYRFVGFVNVDDSETLDLKLSKTVLIKIDDLWDYVNRNSVSEIIVANQKAEGITIKVYNKLIHLLENGFIIREYTQLYEEISQRIPVQHITKDFYRYFPFNRSNQNHLYLMITRVLEIITSIVGLIFGLLIFPFIIVGNLIGNRGPLFYSQERVGKNGKLFQIYKYRTMINNAESNGAVFTTTNDVRITKFGKFLRKTRLDEFPQFINILKGDMAIIGPRPERPIFVNEIAEIMPFYETRHVVKPGLTGWAQVNYTYGDSIQDSVVKLQYDLYYIKHRSLFLDINIMIKTMSTVLFYRGQ